jgi:exopolysaccharide biosynthesis polyprenyl glycosylphosphotransferase
MCLVPGQGRLGEGKRGAGENVSGETIVTNRPGRERSALAKRSAVSWQSSYVWSATLVDALCALMAGALAAEVRFASPHYRPIEYLAITLSLPLVWIAAIALSGGYDSRFIGVGSDEFRKVFNAGITLTATVAIICYAVKFDLARGYIAIALPTATLVNLGARYKLRKRLHAKRRIGACVHRVVVIGHAESVAALVAELHRDSYHGLSVVGACLTENSDQQEIADVPVFGGVDEAAYAVYELAADTVAVLACPELNGAKLRELAWTLEEWGTDVYVAPALLDVAGPRTTIRPIAGLPLLHVDHPELSGAKQVLKAIFDRTVATAALIALAPVFAAIALIIRAGDGGPVFFRQTRVGQNGQTFRVWKFRTMAVDAERQRALLATRNEGNGVLFKIRRDPRITKAGTWLRRYSLDELPQLLNVLLGDMSLVGPRPALPEETAKYGRHMLRRLAVKPGITGLWQVSGRSDLSVDDSVRLDVRYVENWSLLLDLQILWKTGWAVTSGAGAY